MPVIVKYCKNCGTKFNASCGKEEFCTDKCKILFNVVNVNGCWIWQRSKDKDGYGYIKAKGIRSAYKAHRLSYKIFNGEITDGLFVCHKCDNPSCCNPEHLFLGTAQENKHDSIIKDRHATGSRCHKSKITKEQAIYILKSSLSAPKLASEYGIHRNSIYALRSGKTWKSLNISK